MTDETLQEIELPSDAELFSGASETPAETPEPEITEQPRGPDGKYAAKTEEADTPAVETQPDPVAAKTEERDVGQIPAWRLKEEADARRAAESQRDTERQERARERQEFLALQQRMSALEKPAKAEPEPDPLLDPEGYAKRITGNFEERLRTQERNFDMRLAHSRHGKVFEDAYSAAQQALASGDVQLKAMMNATSSPGETLVNWHKQQQTIKEVGSDPNVWLEKKLEERLADPAFLAKAMEKARTSATASQQSRPNVQLPPSLSNVTRGGDTVNTSEFSDPMSDAALFAFANK